MDPDAALVILRQHVQNWETDNANDWDAEKLLAEYADILDHFSALDKWLTTGGFLPKAWD